MWVTNRASHWWIVFWVEECCLAEFAIGPRQRLERGSRLACWAKVAFGAGCWVSEPSTVYSRVCSSGD